jgi:GTP-binding protein Era
MNLNPPVTPNEQKTLYVALMGPSNVGKSTLVNSLVGDKVSIVTPKVQTTRNNIKGIAMVNQAQLVLIDTPGIFKPKRTLERAIVRTAWQGVSEADVLVFVMDAKKGVTEGVNTLLQSLQEEKRPIVLVLNKIDLLSREALLPLSARINSLRDFDRTFMISALKGSGIEDLKRYLSEKAKPGSWPFDPEHITNVPVRFWVAELVREQIFIQLHQELPYQIAVDTEQFKELGKHKVRIDVTIYVTKESQKQIILGKQGSRIKQIGMLVRKEIEKSLNKKADLFLFVKVRENWLDNPAMYQQMGMELPS